MRDFADQLDLRLRSIAPSIVPRPHLSVVPPAGVALDSTHHRLPTRRFRLRAPVIASGVGLATAAAAGAFVLLGTGAPGLPILETETSAAKALEGDQAFVGRGLDLRRGHPFSTPSGQGWIVTTPDQQLLCLALPDRKAPGTHGSSCKRKGEVMRDGLAVEMTGDRTFDADARSTVAVLLPAGASEVRLTTAGRTMPHRTQHRIAVAALRGPGSLSYRAGGRVRVERFAGPMEAATGALCNLRPMTPSEFERKREQGRNGSVIDPC